jgi:hypothetical protein
VKDRCSDDIDCDAFQSRILIGGSVLVTFPVLGLCVVTFTLILMILAPYWGRGDVEVHQVGNIYIDADLLAGRLAMHISVAVG